MSIFLLVLLAAAGATAQYDYDLATSIILDNQDVCGDYGSPDWEILPIEGCDSVVCSLPEQICRYSFLEDVFSCWPLNSGCQQLIDEAAGVGEESAETTAAETTATTAAATTTTAEEEEATTAATSRRTTTVVADDTTTEAARTTRQRASTKRPSTKDKRTKGLDHHRHCCRWASQGECDTNVVFMRPVCQKSCGTYGCDVRRADRCRVKLDVTDCAVTTEATSTTESPSESASDEEESTESDGITNYRHYERHQRLLQLYRARLADKKDDVATAAAAATDFRFSLLKLS